MTSKRYTKIVRVLSEKTGEFDISRGHRFAKLFLKELRGRRVNNYPSNYWRTDKDLYNLVIRKIRTEMEKRESNILIEHNGSKGRSPGANEKEKGDSKDEVNTIQSAPDPGHCKTFPSPAYYELDIEATPIVEDLIII